MGTIEEIKELIEELLEKDDENKISIATSIKKLYSAYRKEKRKEGRLSEYTIKELVTVLRNNYESLKQYAPINETLEMIVEDYNTLSEVVNDDKKEIYKREIFTIHRRILGNPGASIEGMSLDYLKKVIENKIDIENGINKEEIINIMYKVSKEEAIYDFEEYHEFFNDTIMQIVESNITEGTTKLNNPKVIDILLEIAKSYKRNEKYEECKDVCEKGLKLEQFKGTDQYSELQREYEKITKAVTLLDKNFERLLNISEINSAEELIEIIKKYILEGEQEGIDFLDDGTTKEPNPNPNPTPTPVAGKMTLEEKCIALFNFLSELQKENPNIKFSNPSKGKKGTTWDGYLLLPISGADFTILESFDQKSKGLYMVKNENIEKIETCRTKSEVRDEDGVVNANHLSTRPEDYEENLMKKYRELMGLAPIKRNYKKFNNKPNIKNNDENKEEVYDDISGDNVEEINLENLSDEELLALTEELDKGIEELEEENKELQEEAERLEKEKKRKALIEEAKAKRAAMNAKKTENSQLKQKVKELKEEPNKKTSNTHTQE